MPLQKILFKPGVNRENTRYTTEGGWFECDKVRFRQGNPESIGGWLRISANVFVGVCRSLWNWVTLANENLIGVGTNLKFYIESGGAYNDITPIRETVTLNNPFALAASTTVTVTDVGHGGATGDYVTFSGATDIGAAGTNVTASVLNKEFTITVLTADTYTITISVTPNATALAGSPGGGSAVVAKYQIGVGPATVQGITGWGVGGWSGSTLQPNGTTTLTGWGQSPSSTTTSAIRLWSQNNWGEDLVFGPRKGGIYYWDATGGLTQPGVLLNTLGGSVSFTAASPTVVTFTTTLTEGTAVTFDATSSMPTGISTGTTYYLFNVNGLTANIGYLTGSPPTFTLANASSTGSGVYIKTLVDVPTVQNQIFVSDVNKFLFAFGCNNYGETAIDPMLIRWSDQANIYEWTPDATNQAGSLRLSHGSEIVAVVQTRQEIVAITDASIYSIQYFGPPIVWGAQLLGDNISIAGPNAAIIASGVVYWMGVDKFYAYDGRVQTLNCDLRRYVFSDINQDQSAQFFAGTNEGFNEVWWFYCSAGSEVIDRYVVYNYVERAWYYGTMARTAWLDSGLRDYPVAATYSYNLVNHEQGLNDQEGATATAINAYIASSEFDIGDGHNFGFVWRVLPDLTFSNSLNSPSGDAPKVTMTLYGLYNSGSGSVSDAGSNVTKGSTYVVTEEFTGQIYTRVRGRQMIFRMESDQVNTAWQLGAPRIDIRADGRR